MTRFDLLIYALVFFIAAVTISVYSPSCPLVNITMTTTTTTTPLVGVTTTTTTTTTVEAPEAGCQLATHVSPVLMAVAAIVAIVAFIADAFESLRRR